MSSVLPLLAVIPLFFFIFTGAEKETVLVAAGDISCTRSTPQPDDCRGKDVWKAFPENKAHVLALGDLIQKGKPTRAAYLQDFQRTWPEPDLRFTPGNHDYWGSQKKGYNAFARKRKHPAGDYYWQSNGWHFVSLNSNCDRTNCQLRQGQLLRLARFLQREQPRCLLAYFHHPLFKAYEGKDWEPRPLQNIWNLLHLYGADLVLNGHYHYYERFPRLDSKGNPDEDGPRQFTVGTGGSFLFGRVQPHPRSESLWRQFGFLELGLRESSYRWSFKNTENGSLDEGSDSCQDGGNRELQKEYFRALKKDKSLQQVFEKL